jgi:hypothetical protein
MLHAVEQEHSGSHCSNYNHQQQQQQQQQLYC